MSENTTRSSVGESSDSRSETDGPDTTLSVVQGTPSEAMTAFGIDTMQVSHTYNDHPDERVYAGRSDGRNGMDEVDPRNRGWIGNPFPETDDRNKKDCCRFFEQYLDRKLEDNEALQSHIASLADENLMCWCQNVNKRDTWCHCIVVLAYATYYDAICSSDTE